MPCTAHPNLITPHSFTITLLCTYYCFIYSSFVYCHFVYLTFLLLFAVVTHILLKFQEQLNVLWNILAIHTSLQLSKSHPITKCTNIHCSKTTFELFFLFLPEHSSCGYNNPTCLKLQSMSVDVLEGIPPNFMSQKKCFQEKFVWFW